jgi:hypothetical protein
MDFQTEAPDSTPVEISDDKRWIRSPEVHTEEITYERKKIIFDLREIRWQLYNEEISELIDMLEESPIVHKWVGERAQDYMIHVRKYDKGDDAFNSDEVVIRVSDYSGRFIQEIRSPTSTDTFYNSCIEIIQKMRKQK